MKLKCAKHDLAFGIQTVQKAVASRIAIPALGGILLVADASEKKLTLRATDLELTISCQIDAEVEAAGSLVVPGRFLSEICRNLNADVVSLESDGTNMVLTCGKSKYNLRTLPAEEFPERSVVEGASIRIDQTSLLRGIKKVSRAAAKDESRPTISGVLISLADGKFEIVATDSYRLAMFSAPISNEASDGGGSSDVSLILPTRSLDEVVRIFSSEAAGQFDVVIGDGEVAFVSDAVSVITRTIEGSFPQYRQIIPQDYEVKVQIDKNQLLGAVRRAAVVANSSPLKFSWQEGSVEITAGTQEVGEAQEAVETDFASDPFEIAFNALFLQDGLQQMEGDQIEFKFNSPVKPGLISCSNDEGYLYLIMPVRLN